MNDEKPKSSKMTIGELTDRDLEDMVSFMWENIDMLPIYVKKALERSLLEGEEGEVFYSIVAAWSVGKIEWEPNDIWAGTKHRWVPSKSNVN